MHMFAVLGHPDQPHFTLPPPHHAPAPPVKKKFPSQLPVRNGRSVRPKINNDEAASELHKIYNIGEDSEKHAILSVSTAKKLKKLVKPTLHWRVCCEAQ